MDGPPSTNSATNKEHQSTCASTSKVYSLEATSLTSAEGLDMPTCSATDETLSPELTSLPLAEEMDTPTCR